MFYFLHYKFQQCYVIRYLNWIVNQIRLSFTQLTNQSKRSFINQSKSLVMSTNEDSDGMYQSPTKKESSMHSRVGYSSTPDVSDYTDTSPNPSKKRSKHLKRDSKSRHTESFNGSSDTSLLLGYNSSPATTPQGRDNKAGWYDIHNKHHSLASTSRTTLVLCGDSIIAGLSRYPKIWGQYFKPFRALNFGIGGDRTQHVLWRAENLDLPETAQIVVLHCGTNNIDRDRPHDIANGVASVGLAFQEKRPGVKIIVTGLLPRDADWTYRRDKIIKTNKYMKLLCKDKLKDFYFMKQDVDWTLKDGKLNEKLFYTDCLHLIETGNDKFAKSIVSMVYKVRENTHIEYSSEESGDENDTSFEFERKYSEKRRHKRRRSSSPDYDRHFDNRKKSRFSGPGSSPRKSYHRSPFKWEKDEKRTVNESTPNKWSTARKWNKVIKEEHHDKYSRLSENSRHHSRYTYRKETEALPKSEDEASSGETEEKVPDGTAKSIDISLDDRKRLEARRAKFGIVSQDSKNSLSKLSSETKSELLTHSTAAPSALVARIRKSVEQARREIAVKKKRKPSLVTYSSPSSQDDSQEESLEYKGDKKKLFSDYGAGSDSE